MPTEDHYTVARSQTQGARAALRALEDVLIGEGDRADKLDRLRDKGTDVDAVAERFSAMRSRRRS